MSAAFLIYLNHSPIYQPAEDSSEAPVGPQPSDELLASGHFEMPFSLVRDGTVQRSFTVCGFLHKHSRAFSRIDPHRPAQIFMYLLSIYSTQLEWGD